MQAGQVYEIFVDCTRNDLVTNADILDEIVSQLNEKLGITTRWERYSRPDSNSYIRIYLPSSDLKMHDRTQFIALEFPVSNASNAKQDVTDRYEAITLACFYNSTFVNCEEMVTQTYFVGSEKFTTPFGLLFNTGQLTIKIDTTMWTEQNNVYQIYAIFTTGYSGVEALPSNVKFANSRFITKIKKNNPNVEYDVFLSTNNSCVFWAATPNDYALIVPTEQPSETSITLHKVFSGAYENDYWYWLRAGDNSTVKEYVSYDRLPSIESDHRKIKSLDDEYDAFLIDSKSSSTNGQSLVLKKL